MMTTGSSMMNNLNSLKEKLDKNTQWPTVYMFKFIVPAEIPKVARVEALFSEKAVIYRKTSKNGKYISITAKETMHTADEIIKVYHKASGIENIMAL